MTNLVSADRPFRINTGWGTDRLPAVLLCASDGFFGYLHTPAEFEHVLLDTLMRSADPGGWARRLADEVAGYSGDDASLSLLAAGFGGFDELRGHFRPRAHLVATEHSQPVRAAAEQGHAALVAARADSWSRYRPRGDSAW